VQQEWKGAPVSVVTSSGTGRPPDVRSARQVELSRRAGPGAGPRILRSTADVADVLQTVNAAAARRDRTGTLLRAVDHADDVAYTTPDVASIVAVVPELASVVPWRGGLRKGTTVAAVGSNSLLLVLLAEAMATGSTAAVVGRPDLDMVAAGEGYGIDLARLER
jgi:hypothetical protein